MGGESNMLNIRGVFPLLNLESCPVIQSGVSIGLLFSSHSDKAHQDASQALLHTKLHQEKLQQGKTFPCPCYSIHFIISVLQEVY